MKSDLRHEKYLNKSHYEDFKKQFGEPDGCILSASSPGYGLIYKPLPLSIDATEVNPQKWSYFEDLLCNMDMSPHQKRIYMQQMSLKQFKFKNLIQFNIGVPLAIVYIKLGLRYQRIFMNFKTRHQILESIQNNVV